jgi:predicted transcriptional regulator
VTTNEELQHLMRKHNLSQTDVSKMLEIPLDTVKNYSRTANRSRVPKVVIIALRLSIQLRDKTE